MYRVLAVAVVVGFVVLYGIMTTDVGRMPIDDDVCGTDSAIVLVHHKQSPQRVVAANVERAFGAVRRGMAAGEVARWMDDASIATIDGNDVWTAHLEYGLPDVEDKNVAIVFQNGVVAAKSCTFVDPEGAQPPPPTAPENAGEPHRSPQPVTGGSR